jgi:hypothetical protein
VGEAPSPAPPCNIISDGAKDAKSIFIRLRKISSANCPMVTVPLTASTKVIPYLRTGCTCWLVESVVVVSISTSRMARRPRSSRYTTGLLLQQSLAVTIQITNVLVPKLKTEQTSRLTTFGCGPRERACSFLRSLKWSGVSVSSTRATLYPANTNRSAMPP